MYLLEKVGEIGENEQRFMRTRFFMDKTKGKNGKKKKLYCFVNEVREGFIS